MAGMPDCHDAQEGDDHAQPQLCKAHCANEAQSSVRAASPEAAASRTLARTAPGDWILLKASRGMRLERVLAAMRAQLSRVEEKS